MRDPIIEGPLINFLSTARWALGTEQSLKRRLGGRTVVEGIGFNNEEPLGSASIAAANTEIGSCDGHGGAAGKSGFVRETSGVLLEKEKRSDFWAPIRELPDLEPGLVVRGLLLLRKLTGMVTGLGRNALWRDLLMVGTNPFVTIFSSLLLLRFR